MKELIESDSSINSLKVKFAFPRDFDDVKTAIEQATKKISIIKKTIIFLCFISTVLRMLYYRSEWLCIQNLYNTLW